MDWFKTSLGRLRVIGWGEGLSFLLLLGIAMPLKYWFGQPGYVRVVGMAHGALFLLYVAAAWQAAMIQEWAWRRTALATDPHGLQRRRLQPIGCGHRAGGGRGISPRPDHV